MFVLAAILKKTGTFYRKVESEKKTVCDFDLIYGRVPPSVYLAIDRKSWQRKGPRIYCGDGCGATYNVRLTEKSADKLLVTIGVKRDFKILAVELSVCLLLAGISKQL